MKTSSTDIRDTERYLGNKLDPMDALVFEARMLTSRELRLNVHIQKKLMVILKYFYRKQLKKKADMCSTKLFNDPAKQDFQKTISQLFKQ